MEQLFLHKDLLFNIVMNTDILDLYLLYHTNHQIQSFINQKYVMHFLSKKYDARYDEYDEGYYNFYDLVWDALVNPIGFKNKNLYLKDEIIRAVAVINNRFLNSGDKITMCTYKYEEWICQAAMFLKINGFDMDQIFKDLDDIYDYKKQNQIYLDWLIQLKRKTINYYINSPNTLLDHPFTYYKQPVGKLKLGLY